MAAPTILAELVQRFERNRASYQASGYNETQLRREFLDPFFKALGWDIDNEQGHAEAYKDVIHEDAIKVGGATKAPDYCFRIGGRRIFFLEAKKPSVKSARRRERRLPAPPLRLERQAAALGAFRLRGTGCLRLPRQARQTRQALRRPRAVFHVRPVHRTRMCEDHAVVAPKVRYTLARGGADKCFGWFRSQGRCPWRCIMTPLRG
jgi:hypothetical protein